MLTYVRYLRMFNMFNHCIATLRGYTSNAYIVSNNDYACAKVPVSLTQLW